MPIQKIPFTIEIYFYEFDKRFNITLFDDSLKNVLYTSVNDMLLGVMWAFLITETAKFYELQIVFCFHLEVKI